MRRNLLASTAGDNTLRLMPDDRWFELVPPWGRWRFLLPVWLCLMGHVSVPAAELVPEAAPRALPKGHLPNDQRLGPLRDLQGYFPFKPCRTREE
jgi:hypothetical protein